MLPAGPPLLQTLLGAGAEPPSLYLTSRRVGTPLGIHDHFEMVPMIGGRAVDRRLGAGGGIGNRIAFHLEVLDLAVSGLGGFFKERAKLGGSPVDRLQLFRRDAVGGRLRMAADEARHLPLTAFHSLGTPSGRRGEQEENGERKQDGSLHRVHRVFLSWRTDAGRGARRSWRLYRQSTPIGGASPCTRERGSTRMLGILMPVKPQCCSVKRPLPPGIEIPGYRQPSRPGLSPGQGR